VPLPIQEAPIERRSARDVVLERLTVSIESGALEPGEVIKDAELATRLGVSRTPVREALQILEQRGLVEMQPGRLTRITETTPDDAVRVYAPMQVLQALAAELGTRNAGSKDVETMRSCNARLLAAVEAKDLDGARDADREFHDVLVGLADNRYLASALRTLMSHTRRLDALFFRDQQPGRESFGEHEDIIAAVTAGEATTAGALTHRNFQRHWSPPGPGRDMQRTESSRGAA